MSKYLFILGVNILSIGIDLIGIGLITGLIYLFGKFMEYVSDKKPKLEWINTIVAFFCIFLTVGIILLSIKILITLIPYVLIILTFMLIIGMIIVFISYLIDLFKKIINYKK